MVTYTPVEDGFTHINIYGYRTDEWRFLCPMENSRIDHPYFGSYRTMEGLYQDLRTGFRTPSMKVTSGFESASIASTLPTLVERAELAFNVEEVFTLWLLQNHNARQRLLATNLPLVYRRAVGNGAERYYVELSETYWFEAVFERIRQRLRCETPGVTCLFLNTQPDSLYNGSLLVAGQAIVSEVEFQSLYERCGFGFSRLHTLGDDDLHALGESVKRFTYVEVGRHHIDVRSQAEAISNASTAMLLWDGHNHDIRVFIDRAIHTGKPTLLVTSNFNFLEFNTGE